MPTLTLDLPDTAYRAALTLTPRQRNRFAAVMFATLETIDADLPDFDRETNEADLEAIGRSLEAEARGETVPGDVALAGLMEQARRGPK